MAGERKTKKPQPFGQLQLEDFVYEAQKTIEKMEAGKTIKDKKYTMHGLEGLTEEGMALKRGFRNDAWDAVLWEQEYQYRDGKRDSLLLSQVYREVSKDAEWHAMQSAAKLHREVVKYCTSDDIDVRNAKPRRRRAPRRSSFNL